MSYKVYLNKLNKGLKSFNLAKGYVESSIYNKVDFNFSIDHNPADGWIMIDDFSNNASLEPLLNIIKDKGFLSEEDYSAHKI